MNSEPQKMPVLTDLHLLRSQAFINGSYFGYSALSVRLCFRWWRGFLNFFSS